MYTCNPWIRCRHDNEHGEASVQEGQPRWGDKQSSTDANWKHHNSSKNWERTIGATLWGRLSLNFKINLEFILKLHGSEHVNICIETITSKDRENK